MGNSEKITVRAKILPDYSGGFRIYVQRAKRKWWRELGSHEKTDTAFWVSLDKGQVEWQKAPKVRRLLVY